MTKPYSTHILIPGSPLYARLSIDKQIDFFEYCVRHTILAPVEALLEKQEPLFDLAVLAVLNAIPEMLAQYQGATGDKPALYKHGLQYIFQDTLEKTITNVGEEIEKLLYINLRSAVAHSFFTGERVKISPGDPNLTAFLYEFPEKDPTTHLPRGLLVNSINAREWYGKIKNALISYIADLRDESKIDLRNKFQQRIQSGYN